MKIRNALLIIALSGGLVACESSSLHPEAKGTPNVTAKTSGSSVSFSDGTYRGKHINVVGKEDNAPFAEDAYLTRDLKGKSDVLVVGDVRINLNKNALKNDKRLDGIHTGHHSAIGRYKDRDIFFAYGMPTPAKVLEGLGKNAADGTLYYRGKARTSKNGSLEEGMGEVVLSVKLANKKLSGNIFGLGVEANINGNTFAGKKEKKDRYTTEIQGGFYGSRAEEIAGVFSADIKAGEDKGSMVGAFGASKQP